MTGHWAGIHRGEMRGDRPTKITQASFRGPRISSKAKGIFGRISTHRDAWRLRLAELARCAPEDSSARGPLCMTWGSAAASRGPVVGARAAPWAMSATPSPMFRPICTTGWATTRRASPGTPTPALPLPMPPEPCARVSDVPHAERARQSPRHPKVPARQDSVPVVPGEHLFPSISAVQPEPLSGQVLTDLGLAVQDLLDSGGRGGQVRHVSTCRQRPGPLRHTFGAIIAAQPGAAQTATAPTARPDTGPGRARGWGWGSRLSGSARVPHVHQPPRRTDPQGDGRRFLRATT